MAWVVLLAILSVECARTDSPFVGAWVEPSSAGGSDNVFVVSANGDGSGYTLTGIYDNTAVVVRNLMTEGDSLAFVLPVDRQPKYELTVDGAALRGTVTSGQTSGARPVVWQSRKLVDVRLTDDDIDLDGDSLAVNVPVVLRVRNDGSEPHHIESTLFTATSTMALGGDIGDGTVTLPSPYGNRHSPKELRIPSGTTIRMASPSESGFYVGLEPGVTAWVSMTPARQGSFAVFCGLHSPQKQRTITVTAG